MQKPSLQQQIAVEQVRLISAKNAQSLPVPLMTGAVLVFVLHLHMALTELLLWWSLLLTVVLLRFSVLQRYQSRPQQFPIQSWRRAVWISAVLAGLVWGLGAVWMVARVDLAHQLLILLILIGMAASGAANISYLLAAFSGYLLASLLPVCVWFLLHYDEPHVNAGLIGLFFMLILWLAMRWSYETSLESMRLRFRNLDLLQQLATSNSELAEVNQALLAQSNRDHLTQVANRRYFDEFLDREWRRAFRSGHPLALLMLDIDFFKGYNDTYGHQAGDKCLQKVVDAICHEVFRPGDLTARYGGEEFAVILPETPANDVAQIAEKIRQHVESLKILHSASTVSDYVTISIGWHIVVPDASSSVEELVTRADENLYQAKQTGRNRIYPVLA